MDIMTDLYQQLIIDHNRSPRNYFELNNASHKATGHNPLCGDEIKISIIVKESIIENISFFGSGCAISKASASIMTSTIKGMKIEKAEELFKKFHLLATTGECDDDLGRISVLAGVHKYPSRVKCATLAWHTFHAALQKNQYPIKTE